MMDVPSPLATAVAKVGDRWTLLVAEALLDGPLRFNQLQAAIPGIATSVLSQRLKHLEQEGVITTTAYSQRPPRFAYSLTASGLQLAGALRMLAAWGAEHSDEAAAPHHRTCGTTLDARWYCPTCDVVVEEPQADHLHYA
jgi:DNA-binding HxlR family transcriptional regulator